jgi:hypothetical protein
MRSTANRALLPQLNLNMVKLVKSGYVALTFAAFNTISGEKEFHRAFENR